jgi:hypothetical protein
MENVIYSFFKKYLLKFIPIFFILLFTLVITNTWAQFTVILPIGELNEDLFGHGYGFGYGQGYGWDDGEIAGYRITEDSLDEFRDGYGWGYVGEGNDFANDGSSLGGGFYVTNFFSSDPEISIFDPIYLKDIFLKGIFYPIDSNNPDGANKIGIILSEIELSFNILFGERDVATALISIPHNTVLDAGESTNFYNLSAGTNINISSVPANYVISSGPTAGSKAVLRFGLPTTGLTASKDINIAIGVDSSYQEGQELDVLHRIPGGSWKLMEGKCSVVNDTVTGFNFCSFTTNKLSSFAVVDKIILSSSAPSSPSGTGIGSRDVTVVGASTLNAGEVTNSGVNILTYINIINNFIVTLSGDNWQLSDHSFEITDLDLFNNIVTLVISSEPITLILNKGESAEVDLDGDKINDMKVAFSDVYINRAEITLISLNPRTGAIVDPIIDADSTSTTTSSITPDIIDFYSEKIIKQERSLLTITNRSLVNRLKGRILIQTEEKGYMWYVHPLTGRRHYIGGPVDAFRIMREQGIGITNSDLLKIPINLDYSNNSDSNNSSTSSIDKAFVNKHLGKIFLQVQKNGEAWYVNPLNGLRYFLGRPEDAFNIMKGLFLGISNTDIRQIPIAD